MSTTLRVTGLALGVVFGFWLSWTGFTRYEVILGALLLHEGYLWFMFPVAIATAGAGMWLLRAAHARTLLTSEPVTWTRGTPSREHVVGSALFGLGWAVAGTCPGPAIAQLGTGQLSGVFTLSGIFLGVLLAGAYQKNRALNRQTGTCSS